LAGTGILALQKSEIGWKRNKNAGLSATGCCNGNIQVVKLGAWWGMIPIGTTAVREIFP
jgi:hypothetical protein